MRCDCSSGSSSPTRPQIASCPRMIWSAPVFVARRVDVFDAHQPAAAVRARIEPAGQRGDQRALVQRARWAWVRNGRCSCHVPRARRLADVSRTWPRWRLEQGLARGAAVQLAQPPLQRQALRRLVRLPDGVGAPRIAQAHACGSPRCTRLTTSTPLRMCVRASGSGMKPQPRQRTCASILACIEATVSTSCPPQQVVGGRGQALRRIGDRDRAMALDLVVGQRLGPRRQRVMRRDGEDEGHLAQRAHLDADMAAGVAGEADRQVGMPGDQRLPHAGEHLGAQAQLRAGAGAALGIEALDQLEQRQARDDAVGGDRQAGLPAGGHALHAIGQRVDLRRARAGRARATPRRRR